MALPVTRGQKVSNYEDILMDMVVVTDEALVTGCAAGEVYASAPFVFIVPVTTIKDGSNEQIVPGWTQGHFVVRKQTGTAWTKGQEITFRAVAGQNYLEADVAVLDDPIHAYAFVDALSADTDGQIIGPFLPPFNISIGTGAIADKVLATDGSEGLNWVARV